MKKLGLLVISMLMMSIVSLGVSAVCLGTTESFWGYVTVNGQPSQAGVEVSAWIDGEPATGTNNPIVTTQVGVYGTPDGTIFDPFLKIGASEYDKQEIEFKVSENSGASYLECTHAYIEYLCGDNQNTQVDITCSGEPDSDGDGIPDSEDICPGSDDNVDTDADGTPDGCDDCTDVDEDSFCAEVDDCDDLDATLNPGVEEICDYLDNNCDAAVDETWPEVADYAVTECTVGLGECEAVGSFICTIDGTGIECDAVAGDPTEEICDGLDNNCDGEVDEGVCVADTDGDGVPDDVDQCEGFDDNLDVDADGIPDGCDTCTDVDLDGFCAEDLDCNDDDVLINPDMPEICDGLDNNCNTEIDEGLECVGDSDGDGVNDDEDICPGGDDTVDTDADTLPDACDDYPDNPINVQDSTVEIAAGWTMFSLPFNPIGVANSEELGAAIMAAGTSCDVIMTYDEGTQSMVDDVLGALADEFDLTGTDGYFIHCDSAVSFTYTGSMW